MKPNTRRVIAYIVGQAASVHSSGSVYDYTESKQYTFSGGLSAGNVSVYDYTEKCHVNGSLSSIYHFGNKKI